MTRVRLANGDSAFAEWRHFEGLAVDAVSLVEFGCLTRPLTAEEQNQAVDDAAALVKVSRLLCPQSDGLFAADGPVHIEPLDTKVETLPDGDLRVSMTGGVKASRQKRPLHLLPFDALESITDVLDFGSRKYAARNWEKGLSTTDLTRAAIGHLWDWLLRRNGGRDPETGLSHLAHAGCCVLFLIAHELRGLPDDRPGPVAEVPRPDTTNWPAPKS